MAGGPRLDAARGAPAILLKDFGLERRAKPVPDLQSNLAAKGSGEEVS